MVHRFRLAVVLPVALLAIASTTVGGRPTAAAPRVLIIGFDGVDYALTRDLMAQGRLPNISHVAAQGSLGPIRSSIPAQSPVAWSTFLTGRDPGVHGIFDFVHRDPRTMSPYMSTTKTETAHTLSVGNWKIPVSAHRIESLRHGQPFWEALTEHRIESTIIRMPTNFPPTGTATRELTGMGTPDILGTYGMFSYYTSAPGPARTNVNGGTIYRVSPKGDVVEGALEGPDQPHVLAVDRRRLEKVQGFSRGHPLRLGDVHQHDVAQFALRQPLSRARADVPRSHHRDLLPCHSPRPPERRFLSPRIIPCPGTQRIQ